MPTQPTKIVPRPCPSCGRKIKQKYFTNCIKCRQREKRLAKEAKKILVEMRNLGLEV